MRIEAGNPKLETTQSLPDFPYTRYAESTGLRGVRVDKPEDVASSWKAAFQADRPMVFEASVSGDVPTIPPHISFELAKKYTTALMKGDPDEGGIVRQSVEGLIKEVLPQRGG